MDFEHMNAIQRRLHNAACTLGADGDEYGFEQLQRDAIAEIERMRCALVEAADLAGHYQAQRDEERGRMASAVLALGLASQCIHAAANDHWESFDRLSDDFDDAMAGVINTPGAIVVTPEAMRSAAADADKAVAAASCGNCLTPDACSLRGQCGHELRHGA